MTAHSRSLLHNVRSALSGNIIYALSQFGMLSVLALLTDAAEVGRYALALAITGPMFLFASFKLRHVQVTDAQYEYSFREYLGHRLLTSVAATAGVAGLVFAQHMESRTAATVAGVAVFKALESIIDILYGAMQRREQLHLVARLQMWRGIGGFSVFAGAVALGGRVEAGVMALALFTVAQTVTTFFKVRKLSVVVLPKLSWSSFRRLTWLAFPLGLGLLVSSLAANIPRYFIEAEEGTAELGVFAALAYVLTVTSMVVNSLGEAASPRLANLFFAGAHQEFRSTLKKLVVLGVAIGGAGLIGVVLVGGPVLGLLFGPEYAARKDVLVVMMAASAALYTTAFLGTAVNAMRKFAVQLPINAGILLTAAMVSWLTIPEWGIMGGAVAMAAGEVVGFLCYVGLLFKVILPGTSGLGRRVPRRSRSATCAPRHMAAAPKGRRGPN